MQTLPLSSPSLASEAPPALIAPFAVLILLIAITPLAPRRVKHWWERWYPAVAIGLGSVVALWYLVSQPHGPAEVSGVLREYGAFIALIGSLYVVAAGVHVGVGGSAAPWENVRFLLIGALLANFIGTTGASMVLVRPYLRMNAGRVAAHHVVFFIFVVSNCGGALTPIGDPPLFLGYLRGVPFFWLMEQVFFAWAFVIAALLAVFWWIDWRAFRVQPAQVRTAASQPDIARFAGWINVALMAVVVGAVFIPGDIPWFREGVMIAAAGLSLRFTPKIIHEINAFTFGPIREVAVLFFGIFLTMMPALEYVAAHGKEFGVREPMQFYVTTGALSAALDNAPTYATFFGLATVASREVEPEAFPPEGASRADITTALLSTSPGLVMAVSLGAVFFGAMTYIGNGPNFMVKAIAESAGVKMPSFFGYLLRFALPVLLPILLLAGWIFL